MAKNLTCGCCGCGFMTWPGYVDQDQDKGFGICKDCQDWIQERQDKELDKIGDKLRAALNEKNGKKWDGFDIETRRLLAMKAVEEGIVTWVVGGKQ